MKNYLITLLLLIGLLLPTATTPNPDALVIAPIPAAELQSGETELVAGLFGLGKPKYNKRKIDRQISPKRMNRRAKRIQRRYNLAAAPSINWTLIDVQLDRPVLAYELRKGVSHG